MKRKPKSIIGMILGLFLMYPFIKLYENGYISSNMVIPAFFGGLFLIVILMSIIYAIFNKDDY
jgi:RsiW-degrading membrane proteinase PrsW (M82 family)